MIVSTYPSQRHHRLIRGISVGLLLCLMLFAPAAAQEPAPVIGQANLRLWPEYDDPGLLVIFAGEFADDGAFPRQVAFPLPEGARGIQATVQDSESGLLNQPWENVGGELTYTLPLPGFHMEYYVDLPPAGAQRVVEYGFRAPYQIQLLEISIQQPARATDFSVVPEPSGSSQGADGFMYYQLTRANMAPDEMLPITLRYTKSDQGLSLAQPAAPSANAQGSPSSPGQLSNWLPWLLIGLGGAALAGLLTYWFFQQRQPTPITRANRKKTGPTEAHSAPRHQRGSGTYCTQCGHVLGPNDRFCAQCGAPRRSA